MCVNHFNQHASFNNPLINLLADPISLGMPIRAHLEALQKEASRAKKKAAKVKWMLSKMKKNFRWLQQKSKV